VAVSCAVNSTVIATGAPVELLQHLLPGCGQRLQLGPHWTGGLAALHGHATVLHFESQALGDGQLCISKHLEHPMVGDDPTELLVDQPRGLRD